MISRNEVLRRGVESLLRENARERTQLLSLIGVKEKSGSEKTALDILQATTDAGGDTKPREKAKRKLPYGPKNLHWTQMPKNKKRVQEMSRRAAKTRRAQEAKGASSNA